MPATWSPHPSDEIERRCSARAGRRASTGGAVPADAASAVVSFGSVGGRPEPVARPRVPDGTPRARGRTGPRAASVAFGASAPSIRIPTCDVGRSVLQRRRGSRRTRARRRPPLPWSARARGRATADRAPAARGSRRTGRARRGRHRRPEEVRLQFEHAAEAGGQALERGARRSGRAWWRPPAT